jgi:hypothetical protein
MEIKKIEEELSFQGGFELFIKRLQRWHNISFDSETLKEFISISTQFNSEDFNFCHEKLRDDPDLVKRYKISPTIVYRLCLESKKEREKRDRLKKEIENSETLTFNKAGRDEVEKAIKDLKKALKNKRKSEKNEKKSNITLYEYLDLESGKTSKVLARGDLNETIFVKACKEKFYSRPHSIKKIYHKTITKEQLDRNGNPISKYTSLQPVSSMSEGSVLYTVGYY